MLRMSWGAFASQYRQLAREELRALCRHLQGDMHIMNAMPPTQSNVPTEKVLRPSTLVSGLKRMMSKDKTDSAPVSPLPSDDTSLDRLLPAPQTASLLVQCPQSEVEIPTPSGDEKTHDSHCRYASRWCISQI